MRTIRSKIWCVKLLRVAIMNGPSSIIGKADRDYFRKKSQCGLIDLGHRLDQ